MLNDYRLSKRWWLCSLILFLSLNFAWGQNDTPPAEKVAPIRDTSIYIPFTKLRSLFEKDGRGVFIPYEKFQELLKAARSVAQKLPDLKPPVDALITQIESNASVEGDVLLVKAELTVELLQEGWLSIPIRLGDCAIRSAQWNKEPARLIFKEGSYHVLVERSGKAAERGTLSLEYTKAFVKAPNLNSVALQAPQAALNHWKIRIHEPGIKVNVHPQVATESNNSKTVEGAKETLVEAHVGAAAEIRIDWAAKSEGAAGLTALVAAQTKQEVSIEEGVVRSRITFSYEISRSELKQLTLELPSEKDFKVVNVFDANVKKWEVTKKNENSQSVVVDLDQPAKGQQPLVLELEHVSPDLITQGVKIPAVKAVDAARQFGVVAVRVSPTLQAELASQHGLSQLDHHELPGEMAKQGGWTFAYRFSAVPYALQLTLAQVQPRIEATEFVEVYIEPRQITIDLLASLLIERAGIFSVDVDLPEGFQVQSVVGRAIRDVPAATVESRHLDPKNKTKLTVNFSRKALGKTAFVVRLVKQLNEPKLLTPSSAIQLPELVLPRVAHAKLERSQGHSLVYVPEALRVEPQELKGLRTIATEEAVAQQLSVREGQFPQLRETLAFAFHRESAAAVLEVERRAPQITVRQLLTAFIDSGVVKYKAQFQYEIRYSGVKSLRIDVPTALVEKLHLEGNQFEKGLIQPPPADVAKDYTAWEIRSGGELLGTYQIPFTWQEPLADLEVGKTKQIDLPLLQPQNDARSSTKLERVWGQIAIAKAETIDIAEAKEPTALRPIDPQVDWLDRAGFPNAARAYEFYEPWTLSVAATRYELEDVSRTSIDRAYVRVVATHGQQLAVQAIYRLSTARQRIKLALPAALDPATAFDDQALHINGKKVLLEKEAGAYWVPIATPASETPVLVELKYNLAGTAAHIELPHFPEEPAVQKVYVAAFLPKEWAMLGQAGNWSDEQPWQPPPILQMLGVAPQECGCPTDDELLGWVQEGLSLPGNPRDRFSVVGSPLIFSALQPPPGDDLKLSVWDRFTLDVCVFVAILALGVGCLARPLSERFVLLGAVFAVVFLAAVFQPHFAEVLLRGPLVAATVLVLGIWFVRYLAWVGFQMPSWARSSTTQRPLATVPPATQPTSPSTNETTPANPESPREGGDA